MNDKRFHKRIPHRAIIHFNKYILSDGTLLNIEESTLELFDISIYGAGISTDVNIEPGSFLNFTLYVEQIPYQVLAQIRWKSSNQDIFRYGVEFIQSSNMMFRHLKEYTYSSSTSSGFYTLKEPENQ